MTAQNAELSLSEVPALAVYHGGAIVPLIGSLKVPMWILCLFRRVVA